MDRLAPGDIPIRIHRCVGRRYWRWETTHYYHGKRWYVEVPIPRYWEDRRAPAYIFENALCTLAYMIEHNCEID